MCVAVGVQSFTYCTLGRACCYSDLEQRLGGSDELNWEAVWGQSVPRPIMLKLFVFISTQVYKLLEGKDQFGGKDG